MSTSSTILLMSGSLRQGSVNEATLQTARRLLTESVQTRLAIRFDQLPHFNPDLDQEPLPLAVATLRAEIAAADALLICTPEYAGALPGAFKNLLDWTVGGAEMTGKKVAWINTAGAAAPSGGEDAHASLRVVLGYLGAVIVEPACIRLPVARSMVGTDGLIKDEDLCHKLKLALVALTSSLAHT